MATSTGIRYPAIPYIPGGVASFSRSQLYLPGKLSIARVRSDSWVLGSSSSKLASPTILAPEKAEAKAVLTLFLKKQGLSDAAAESTVNKSDLFIDHLVSRLPSIPKSWYRVGRELSTLEIRDALIPYLESSVEEHGDLLVDFVENFQKPPDQGKTIQSVPETRQAKSFRLRVHKALETIHERGPDGTLHPTVVYLMELGLDLEQVEHMARIYPPTPFLSVEQNLIPTVNFLLDLGVSKSDVPIILAMAPRLCGYSITEKFDPRLAFLESLGVDKKNWARLIGRCPNVLWLSRKKIEETVSFLYEMDVSAESVGKILTKYPNIVGCSVEENLRPTAEFFHCLGVDVALLLRRYPSVFGLSVENHLRQVTEFFLRNGFSSKDLAEMITRFGSLCHYRLATLSRKFDYFLTLGYSREQLVKFPEYFSFSLEGRMKPRFALVKECGLSLSLNQVLNVPDDVFKVRLRNRIVKLQTGQVLNLPDDVAKVRLSGRIKKLRTDKVLNRQK